MAGGVHGECSRDVCHGVLWSVGCLATYQARTVPVLAELVHLVEW